ncbi:MAG: hypothetical protein KA149_01545 [Chitinophagales bacterium]|nr:hypothetical protein [Chitinophagales bacterium]
MNHIKQNKRSKIVWLVAILIPYFFYMKTSDHILNYPRYLYYFLFLFLSVTFFIFNLKETRKGWTSNTGKLTIIVESVGKFIVLPWFIVGILLLPLNYYIIYSADRSNSVTLDCEITGVSIYNKNRTIFFILENRVNSIYGYAPIMEKIETSQNYKNHKLVIDVKKSVLNTYVMNGWEIKDGASNN